VAARILIIEDDPASLELVSYLLTAAGYQPKSEIDGAAGLERVRADRPDLVICDLQLPIMDGFSVVRALKSDPALARIPVIAVTALSMPGDQEKTMAAGFDGYLSKPIEPESFVRLIEAYLAESLRIGAG
jgi:CheY-like chemotaxis protein